jgi:phage-related minor tail protein
LGAVALATNRARRLNKQKKALKRKVSDLEKKLAASEEHRKEHLNVARDRYREEIEWQKKHLEASHEEKIGRMEALIAELGKNTARPSVSFDEPGPAAGGFDE